MGTEQLGLPSSAQGLLDGLRSASAPGGPLTYEVIERLGAMRGCDCCGAPIVLLDGLIEALVEHYSLQGDERQGLERAVTASGLEFGDNLSPNYCSYHAQITSE